MGIFDKIKKIKNQGDDDLDELDMDLDGDEDGEETPNASSGGGLSRAMGFMKKAKNRFSDGEGDEDDEDDMGGGIEDLKGNVKKPGGRKNKPRDLDLDDDDDALDESSALETDQDDDDGEDPIRRSGIAAALDGDSAAAENSDEEEDAAPDGAGGLGLDLGALFEVDLVVNPILKDLAEFVDDVSAVELAADLRTFLNELR